MPDQDGTTQLLTSAMTCCEIAAGQAQLNLQLAESFDQKIVAQSLHDVVLSQNAILAAVIERYLSLGEMFDSLVEDIKKHTESKPRVKIVNDPETRGDDVG